MRPSRDAMAARAWAWPSAGGWRRRWTARSRPKARASPARAATFHLQVRLAGCAPSALPRSCANAGHRGARRQARARSSTTTRPTGASSSRSWRAGRSKPQGHVVAARGARLAQGAAIQFDIAMLDLFMPEIDGIELAEQIRAARSRQRMPLVLARRRRHARAPRAGVFDCASDQAGQAVRPARRAGRRSSRAEPKVEREPEQPARRRRAGQAPLRCCDPAAPRTTRSTRSWRSACSREHGLRPNRRRRPAGASTHLERHRLRRRADGRADARAGRTRGDAADPRASGRSGRCTSWP